MKVLLTGYAGFLGRRIADAMTAKGWTAKVILHSLAMRKRDFKQGFEVIWGDLSTPETIDKAVQGVDAIIHSAWVWPQAVAGNDRINHEIVKQLYEKASSAGVSKFVFISSVAVYGMGKRSGLVDEAAPFAAGRDLEPPYPRHKVEVEQYLKAQMEKPQKMKVAIFRPGVLIDDDKGPARNMQLGGMKLALGFGNGRNSLPFVSAWDVAAAIVKWLEIGKENGVYNVTPTQSVPSREWYRRWGTVHNIAGKPFFIRPFVILGAGLGITLLKRVLGKKSSMLGFRYSMASATRNLRYSNERLKKELDWNDSDTMKYFAGKP